ncbi:hypothetical protein SAMN06265379_103227 [Saccharicrinis carchari]|uniref:Uncharacterized protein n=1 Tax=Saccharicrinis carchari TaxID=1168039 RepID=A0A521CKL3_SACCC|nr:hypothetical protein [Saccharicrinis carchari]SMO59925.1 hypothetical protein SAMN06265379_103227 [Saccharicrinis carchari]
MVKEKQNVLSIAGLVASITLVTLFFKNNISDVLYGKNESYSTIFLYAALLLYAAITYYYRRKSASLEFTENNERKSKKQVQYNLQKTVLLIVVYWILLIRYAITAEYIDLAAVFIALAAIAYGMWQHVSSRS